MSALVLPTAMTTRIDREEDLASLCGLYVCLFADGRGDQRCRVGAACFALTRGRGGWRGWIDPRTLVHAMHPEDEAVVTAVCCGEYGTQYEQTGQRESPE